MKEIIDKISSYNLFNYLLPGMLFVVISENFTSYSFFQKDLIIDVFVAYFIGLVISRFGSLIIEPFLKKISFLDFVDYRLFISASKKDAKIELFSEINNMYRTLASTFTLIILLKLWEVFTSIWPFLKILSPYALVVSLIAMFLYSYKKQTEYIVKRVKANSKKM